VPRMTGHAPPNAATIAASLLAAGMLVACGPVDAPGTAPSPTDGPTNGEQTAPVNGVEAMTFAACEAERYTVGYPADWNTNADDGLLGPCEIFHPGEIDVPEHPRDGDLHYAVAMYVDNITYEDRTTSESPNELIDERETTVRGRPAHVAEVRSTGDALAPEGEHVYTWSIDLDGQILVATTSTIGDTDYERDKRLIDRMVTEELTIHELSPISAPATTGTSSEDPDGWPLVATDIRVGAHGAFERIVFQIAGDGQAGWLVRYENDPRSQGSGHPVDVRGEAVLQVTLRDMAYPDDAPAEPYDGPQRIEPANTSAIVEVVEGAVFEGYHDVFVGLDQERAYRIDRLSDPQRIVIDIQTD
jgi:hypothetical protein